MGTLYVQMANNAAFDNDEKRKGFAEFISRFFTHGKEINNIPYEVVPGRTDEYVVDLNNNWKVVFDKHDNRRARLTYRYGNDVVVEAATRFIAFMHGRVEAFYWAANE